MSYLLVLKNKLTMKSYGMYNYKQYYIYLIYIICTINYNTKIYVPNTIINVSKMIKGYIQH